MKKIRVNIVSESDISVQGHGVHTAYEEMASALERDKNVEIIRGRFGESVDCDIVHLHTIGLRTWRKLLQKNVKKVVSVHVVPDSFIGSIIMAPMWRSAAALYMRWYYSRADVLLAVSSETRKDLLDMQIKKPIIIEYNSIDTSRYRPASPKLRLSVRESLGIGKNDFVVIGAGQAQPRKRLDTFINTARALPDVKFVWVGGMPFGKLAAESAPIKKMIKNAPKNVVFPGIVPLKEMVGFYQAADVFFLPSQQETFGLVVVEAAAAGLPIVLRDLPDYADTFAGNAIMSDEDDFVDVIRDLSRDKKLYKKWQNKSSHIAAQFDSKAAAKRYVELYRSLL